MRSMGKKHTGGSVGLGAKFAGICTSCQFSPENIHKKKTVYNNGSLNGYQQADLGHPSVCVRGS